MSGEPEIVNVRRWPYWLILTVVGGLLFGLFVLYHFWWDDGAHGWIIEGLGIFGTFLSFAGVILALFQIAQANRQLENMRSITEATEKAVKDNRNEIRSLISYSDVAHLCEVIKNVQDQLCQNQISLALYLLKDLKNGLLRIESRIPGDMVDHKSVLIGLIQTLGSDIQSMADHLIDKRRKRADDKGASSLNLKTIHANLETAREEVVKIEIVLNNNKI